MRRAPVRRAEQWSFTVLAVVIAMPVAISLIAADISAQAGRDDLRIAGWAVTAVSGLAALVIVAALVRKTMALFAPVGGATPARLPADVLERRRPVWQALSGLFLDNVVDDSGLRGVARCLAESGYDWSELESIMAVEVAPVLHVNLRMVAGEWAGFDPDWLEGEILRHMGRKGYAQRAGRQREYLMDMVADDWNGVVRHFRAMRGDRRHS